MAPAALANPPTLENRTSNLQVPKATMPTVDPSPLGIKRKIICFSGTHRMPVLWDICYLNMHDFYNGGPSFGDNDKD